MHPNMKEMMRQAQRLQTKIAKLQEELATKTVEVTVGGGMVTAVANGKPEIVSVKLEKEVVDPDDIEMLQDLVVAAVNEALSQARAMVESEMSKLTGGLNIPGLF